jgi:hypothetical protein
MKQPINYFKNVDIRNIGAIFLVFAAIIIFSRIYTLYPVDDDWSYIRTAETFYNTGEIKFTEWTSPSLIFQILWGSLFSLVFGFSVNTLILSTQVISFIGMTFFYLLLRKIGCNSQKSLLFTLLFIFNPYSFPFLYTFFTDHHFISLMFVSSFFYFCGAEHKTNRDIFLGSVFACCALLIRQQGLLIPAGAALYLILRRESWKKVAFSLVLPVITFIIFSCWLQFIHGPTFSSQQQVIWLKQILTDPLLLISNSIFRPIIILEFFGFCLIPVSLAMLPSPGKILSRENTPLLVLFCLSAALLYLISDHAGIYSSIYSWMNGFYFAYVSEYGYRGTKNILVFFYRLFDFVSIFSIIHVAYMVIQGRSNIKKSFSSPFLMLVLIGLFQLGFLMIIHYKFTRYYLIILPVFIMIVYKGLKNIEFQKKYFIPLLLGFALFSFIGTQDFISWNEARWRLGKRTLSQGIPPRTISGGFPWDCWHNMDYNIKHPDDIIPHAYDIPWWFEWLTPAIDPQYLISNSPVPSGFYFLKYFYTDRYTIKENVEYYSLLYLKKMKIFLLKRELSPVKDDNGHVWYRFLDNFTGAEIDYLLDNKGKEEDVKTEEITVNNISRRAIIQPSLTRTGFRVQLPLGKCRLKFHLATDPDTWDLGGNGILFKVALKDHLMENLFDKIGMGGVKQRESLSVPRSYFFGFRTIYMHYLDPKVRLDQRKWHDISLDLSRFSGKVIDIMFVAAPGPKNEDSFDTALWGEPVIETY